MKIKELQRLFTIYDDGMQENSSAKDNSDSVINMLRNEISGEIPENADLNMGRLKTLLSMAPIISKDAEFYMLTPSQKLIEYCRAACGLKCHEYGLAGYPTLNKFAFEKFGYDGHFVSSHIANEIVLLAKDTGIDDAAKYREVSSNFIGSFIVTISNEAAAAKVYETLSQVYYGVKLINNTEISILKAPLAGSKYEVADKIINSLKTDFEDIALSSNKGLSP